MARWTLYEKWERWELDYLTTARQEQPPVPYDVIAAKLERTLYQVYGKARDLGVTSVEWMKVCHRKYHGEDNDRLNYIIEECVTCRGMTATQIAKYLEDVAKLPLCRSAVERRIGKMSIEVRNAYQRNVKSRRSKLGWLTRKRNARRTHGQGARSQGQG